MAEHGKPMSETQIAVVGAGLIGGSLALAGRANGCAARFVAIDPRPRPEVSAADVFDEWISPDDDATVRAALHASTLTLVCVPVTAIMRLLPEILAQAGGVVTDCGSTKQAIVRSIEGHPLASSYVPGHPMAGHPEGGLENARADLFQDRKWILCPDACNESALAKVEQFVVQIGALPFCMSASEHDHAVALISHVPQVVASALSVHAAKGQALAVAGPGFASATRVAGGAETMWRDIFQTNGSAIGEALVQVGQTLTELGQQLQKGQVDGTLSTLDEARKHRK